MIVTVLIISVAFNIAAGYVHYILDDVAIYKTALDANIGATLLFWAQLNVLGAYFV